MLTAPLIVAAAAIRRPPGAIESHAEIRRRTH
jgi:hypothetical protein